MQVRNTERNNLETINLKKRAVALIIELVARMLSLLLCSKYNHKHHKTAQTIFKQGMEMECLLHLCVQRVAEKHGGQVLADHFHPTNNWQDPTLYKSSRSPSSKFESTAIIKFNSIRATTGQN